MAPMEGDRETGNLKSRFLTGQDVAYTQFFNQLIKQFDLQAAWIVTTAPRGALQLIQPAGIDEGFLKAYQKTLYMDDALTWQAIMRRQSVRLSDLPGAIAYSAGLTDWTGGDWAAAAPLRAPLFPGFSGALQVLRRQGGENFTADELAQLLKMARELDRAIDLQRQSRRAGLPQRPIDLSRRISHRLFAFRSDGRSLLPDANISVFDSALQQQILKHFRDRMERTKAGRPMNERVLLPDEYGELWAFHSVAYPMYPALSSGPVLLLTMEPSCPEWSVIHPEDFAADPEALRLAPAMQFMVREFHRMPTLAEISKSVFLSPFHFHRRFSDMFGITPKHFLLECQVYDSKIQLMSREKELAAIATECGFAHQSHFTSRFKQVTGLTPTRWRRMVGERLRGTAF